MADHNFNCWEYFEFKRFEEGKYKGKIRWVDKGFLVKILSAKDPNFVEQVNNTCKNHNKTDAEDIPKGIQILSKFAHIIKDSSENWRGTGKVQKLLANSHAKRIRNEINQEKTNKRKGYII